MTHYDGYRRGFPENREKYRGNLLAAYRTLKFGRKFAIFVLC
jgi:hypothetical protein